MVEKVLMSTCLALGALATTNGGPLIDGHGTALKHAFSRKVKTPVSVQVLLACDKVRYNQQMPSFATGFEIYQIIACIERAQGKRTSLLLSRRKRLEQDTKVWK